MKLIADKNSLHARKVLLVAEYAGLALNVVPPPAGAASCCKEFGSCVLNTPKGDVRSSNSAVRYLARSRPDLSLYGATFYDAAQVDSWIDWASCALDAFSTMCAGDMKDMFNKAVKHIDDHLRSHTYLASECITAADLVVIASLISLQATFATDSVTADKVNFKRWYNTIAQQNGVKKVLGDSVQQSGKAATVQKENKPVGKQPEQPKAEAEENFDAPKVTKCALDDLPASPFVLDAWKRYYSNSKDLVGDAMTYFWQNYDPTGYSLWYMKYEKLDGECTVSFVTSNQLGGFLQRADPNLRKYSFGNFNVVGGDGCFDIIGVWLFRGTDIAPQMKEHPSYEYHKWRKLDHNNAEDKKLVSDYWCSETTCEGKQIADSKVYK